MAIVITKGLPNTATDRYIISAYANRIIKFHSDTITQPAYATVNGYKIYPDSQGKFEYNLKELFKVARESSNGDKYNPYKDDKPIIFNTYQTDEKFGVTGLTALILRVYDDEGVYDENDDIEHVWLSTYAINFLDKQDYKVSDDNEEIIIPVGNKITIFKGYPFDLTVFNANKMQIDNESEVTISQHSSRIYLSDGINNVQKKVIIRNANNAQKIKVKNKNCEGIQLKWLSNNTWKYWLFTGKRKEMIIAKELGNIVNEFTDDNTNAHPIISLGRKATKQYVLHALGLEPYEREYLSDIVISPKVYMYFGTRGEQADVNKYFEVQLKTNQFEVENYNKNLYDIRIMVEHKINTIW